MTLRTLLSKVSGLLTHWRSKAAVVTFREQDSSAGIVFLPGFTGEVVSSWGDLPTYLAESDKLRSWDIFGVNYASSWSVDIPAIWEADPDIDKLAAYISTQMRLPPFDALRSIAFLAHSMGGLVIQRALLDDAKLAGRTSSLVMFGTPSGGIKKAGLGALLKRQARDMAADGKFITTLRSDWEDRYGGATPFSIRTVAGDRDEFVAASSSLSPFPNETRMVIPGNHTSIVKPTSKESASVQVAVAAITREALGDYVDSARLAIELGDFRAAERALSPRFKELDDAALVVLAMALDGLGKGDEAIRILDDVYKGGVLSSAEAAGVMAGRIKRRWLLERRAVDLARATELYTFGLEKAEQERDSAQGYYHAINLAFLSLISSDATADPLEVAGDMAQRALSHCEHAPATNWRYATEGEAMLILGRWDEAEKAYRKGVAATSSPRELTSTRNQALLVASRLKGEEGVRTVSNWFKRVSEDEGAAS